MSAHQEVETVSTAREGSACGYVLVAMVEGAVTSLDINPSSTVVIGRAEDCDLRIDNTSVSRHHMRLDIADVITVEDLESRNGTSVRGIRVAPNHKVRVHPGDVIECGDALLLIRMVSTTRPREDLFGGQASTSPIELVVGDDGCWFQVSGSQRVNMGRRGALRRILIKLATNAIHAPGSSLSMDEMIEAGWPGEKMLYEAATARVYTTVQRLRGLGLQDVLHTRDDGYLIYPSVRVRIVDQ